jgi:predicted small secreted protein
MKAITSISLLTCLMLAACGGGGGAGADTATASTSVPTENSAAATVAQVVPGDGMTWATSAEPRLDVTLRSADGQRAAGAALRVFTASRTSPQGGPRLAEAVPVRLLDTAVSDARGEVRLALRLPAHVEELLLVATLGDQQVRQAVPPADATLALQLAR